MKTSEVVPSKCKKCDDFKSIGVSPYKDIYRCMHPGGPCFKEVNNENNTNP